MVQIERRRIRIGDSETNKMDGLIPVTRPIREDKPRTCFEAMEVDVMGPPPGEESDSEGECECECAALYASGRGGLCYYCAKEGHFLRNCPGKAAGLPRSAPFVEDKGGRRDDVRWKDQRRPGRSGGRAATRRSGGRRRRRGIGGNRGGRSQGEIEGPGGTSGEGPPKPWRRKMGVTPPPR